MKEKETENFKYTQKNMVVGNKMRSVVVIDKKPNAESGQKKVNSRTITITGKKCSGCSRKRRG